MNRLLRLLRPSHQHSAFSATLLLMSAVMVSRVIGYVREAYIAYAFGAGPATDAYVAGFTIPDWLNYLVAGGTASITFVSIYTRFLAEDKEAEAQKTFSVIITVMTAVLGVGILLAEIFTPQISHQLFPKFSSEQMQLCVHLTRILLPAQLLRGRRGFGGIAFAPAVPVSRLRAAALQRCDHCGGCPAFAPAGHRLARLWRGSGELSGTIPDKRDWRGSRRNRLQYFIRRAQLRVSRVGTALHSADAWRVAGYR
jgi:hypothetical protein